jgi:hypothetical protein
MRANAAFVLDRTGYRPSDGGLLGPELDPFAATQQPNFFLGLLGVELSYMRRCAPLAFCGSMRLLSEIAHPESDVADVWVRHIAAEVGGYYAERDFDAHLTVVSLCIAESVAARAQRFPAPPFPPLAPVSGLEFMRQAELLTRAALADWGPNRFVTAIDGLRDLRSPLAAGCYIEEYHVNRRFVEIIAPALCKRLSEPLRALMFRYYSEELGHEEFERATCEALGVGAADLDRAVPLPLHFAFIDAFTEAAERDPIAFFAAIMITEGMMGDPSVVADRLAEVGRGDRKFREVSQQHDHLNRDLHHASIARHAFEQVKAVGVARQQQALGWLLFLMELNHRAWDAVADFYGPQTQLRMHGFLGERWSPEA